MNRRGQPTSMEERLEIDARAIAGETDATIAQSLQRSIWTVRKWRRRVQRGGRHALHSTFGKHTTGALCTFCQ